MLPLKTDVLIIGAGIMGATMGYYLASRGVQVVILEQKEIASGASGANLGQISLADRDPGPELDFAYRSLEIMEEKQNKDNWYLGYKKTGGLYFVNRKDYLPKLKSYVAEKNKAGLACSLLLPEEISAFEPWLDTSELYGAVHCPREGRLDPLAVTFSFIDGAVEQGALVYEDTTVTGFTVGRNCIQEIHTSKGMIQAEQVILATGSWTREIASLLDLDLPIYYHRGSAMVTQALPPLITGPIVPADFLVGSVENDDAVYFSVVQNDFGSILIAQANDVVQNYNVDVTYEGLNGMSSLFVKHLPALADAQVLRAWSGVTTVVEDNLPLFGYSGKWHNLFVAAGFKGAFTLAPAVGEMTAELITTRKSNLICPEFGLERFGM